MMTTLAIDDLEFQKTWNELARLADLAEYVSANLDADSPKSAFRLSTAVDTLIRFVRESNDKMEDALVKAWKEKREATA